MAKMFPPEIPDPDRSRAETRIFNKLKTETPDDWFAIHSVGLASHATKPWAEIDFVVIADSGVWCLEVKGGGIVHREGKWFTNEKPLKESPFAQAGGGSSALFQYLKPRVPAVAQSVVGYGVCFPDCQFQATGPEINPTLIYDDDDLAQPFAGYVDRLARDWADRFHGKGASLPPPLRRNDRSRILHEIAPDFSLVPSLRAQVQGVQEELVRLTEQQAEILRGFEEYDRALIQGAAGTGKTMLAIHEGKRLASEGKRTLLCCFSHRLASDLARRVAGVPNLEVRHIHGLMRDLIDEAGLTDQLPNVDQADLFDVFYPQLSIEALGALDRLGDYDAIVVDEAQDLLKDPYLQVFDALLSNELSGGIWRVFYDPNQDRFEACDQHMLGRLESYCTSGYRLRTNCRNTRQIAVATSLLTTLPLAEVLRVDGPEFIDEWYEDEREHQKALLKIVRDWIARGLRPDQITILSPFRFERSTVAQVAEQLPRRLVDIGSGSTDDGTALRFSTVAGFKGLESDGLILSDVKDLTSAHALLEIYLGASRACALLAVLLPNEVVDDYRDRAKDFAERVSAGAM